MTARSCEEPAVVSEERLTAALQLTQERHKRADDDNLLAGAYLGRIERIDAEERAGSQQDGDEPTRSHWPSPAIGVWASASRQRAASTA